MSQLQLTRVSREIIDHAEKGLVPEKGLPKVVDDYFIQRLKRDELEHATVDARFYEGLRKMVKAEVVPLYEHQKKILAEATLTEGTNISLALVKQREAMASAGGETLIQLAFATNLLGKRIVMIPTGNSINLQTLDLNKALETFLHRDRPGTDR